MISILAFHTCTYLPTLKLIPDCFPLVHLYTTILSFFWPKLTFDFLTTTFHPLVAPVPYLQLLNLLLCASILALEYPAPFLFWGNDANTTSTSTASESSRDGSRRRKDKPAPQTALAQLHARIETRLLLTLPLAMLASVLVYQCASAGPGYAIAWAVWAWGFVEGEVSTEK